ncbi:MAG TPA: hypothetical protein DEA27_04305 [Candidatus Moranbacteria bacterium]|nr:hypothetical protein [Candidatus Moranbacteria bacterium]
MRKKENKNIFSIKKMLTVLVFACVFAISFFPQNSEAALIPCGRTDQAGTPDETCTLCHFIVGFHGIIEYGTRIVFVIAIAVFAIAGVMYTISSGDSGMTGMAKNAMQNAAIGIVVMFSAWLIVNYTMHLLGARPGLGVSATATWSKFECVAQSGPSSNSIPAASAPSVPVPTVSSQSSSGALGESCGENNSGKCMDTFANVCPNLYKHVYGGKSCEWGLGCCK